MNPIVTSSHAETRPAGPTGHHSVHFASSDLMVRTLGPQDALLRILAGVYPQVEVSVRDQELGLDGPPAGSGCSARVSTARSRTLDSGQTVSGIRWSTSRSTRSGSSMHRMP